MKVALGFKAHSGWAALVAIGIAGSELQVVDRRRIELVEQRDSAWAKQPYHAAERLEPNAARAVIRRGKQAAYRIALKQMQATVKSLGEQSHQLAACAVLVPGPMPQWTTEEIVAVHFRMHKAEGVLFPDALARAAEACDLNLVLIPEKTLTQIAEKALRKPASDLTKRVATLGKAVGPHWTMDQKKATLAAMVALHDLK